jgi:hypothetical protein
MDKNPVTDRKGVVLAESKIRELAREETALVSGGGGGCSKCHPEEPKPKPKPLPPVGPKPSPSPSPDGGAPDGGGQFYLF